MAKIGRNLTELAKEIERRAESKRDFIAPASKMSMEIDTDKKPRIVLANGTMHDFGVNDIAHGQLAEYTDIPMAYYRRMMAEDPTLLRANVNRWLSGKGSAKDSRRMLRTLDGNVRAVLSDSYRALENEDLAEAVLPVLLDMDLIFLSCEITERRLYIKCVDKSITRDVPTGKHMGDGGHTIFDTCSPAITISNSEVGYGALAIETGVFTRACTNLAMFGANMRKYHTGRRADLSDEVYSLLTDDTKKATDRAVWMQTRDLVKSAFDLSRFEALTMRLGEAGRDRIEGEQTVEVVEKVGRRFALNEGERRGVLAKLIEGGDLSRYGVHAAITRFSAEESVAYDRATELERLGGEVIELEPHQWKEIIDTPIKRMKLAA